MPWIQKRKISFNKDKKEDVKRHNSRWNKYYQSPLWKKLRHWQITNYPLCADCAINGISRAATQVHHIKPFAEGETEEERMELLLSPENVTSLCEECHRKRHKILREQKNNN